MNLDKKTALLSFVLLSSTFSMHGMFSYLVKKGKCAFWCLTEDPYVANAKSILSQKLQKSTPSSCGSDNQPNNSFAESIGHSGYQDDLKKLNEFNHNYVIGSRIAGAVALGSGAVFARQVYTKQAKVDYFTAGLGAIAALSSLASYYCNSQNNKEKDKEPFKGTLIKVLGPDVISSSSSRRNLSSSSLPDASTCRGNGSANKSITTLFKLLFPVNPSDFTK
jgi:hypothetical protein